MKIGGEASGVGSEVRMIRDIRPNHKLKKNLSS